MTKSYDMGSSSCQLLFPRNIDPYGKSWEEWAALWCKWLLSTPRDKNPSVDEDGQNCAENQFNPRVWFLGGTFGNYKVVKRKCTVPGKRAILFPILEKEDSFVEDSDLKTEEDLAVRANRAMDAVTLLSAKIDGIKKHSVHFRGECLMQNGEIPTRRIESDSIYSQIREYVQDFRTFKVEVLYELTIQK